MGIDLYGPVESQAHMQCFAKIEPLQGFWLSQF